MPTYVTILAGPSAAESRPVISSSHPDVVRAALAAIRRQLGGQHPMIDASLPEDSSSHSVVDGNGPGPIGGGS